MPREHQCLVLVLRICVEVAEVDVHTKEVDPVHSVNFNLSDLYTYAKDQDKALLSFGPRIIDAVLPGFSNSVPTTGSD